MKNKVASLRKLLRSGISEFRDKVYMGEAEVGIQAS